MDGCDRLCTPPERRKDEPTRERPAASTAPSILALQRRAGNRAVVELLRRSVEPDTVQRKIGFEFEMEVPAMQVGQIPPGATGERAHTYRWASSDGMPVKTEILDDGYDDGRYKIESDSGEPGWLADEVKAHYTNDVHIGHLVQGAVEDSAKIEFITAPLDETAQTWEADFTAQLDDVANEMKDLQGADLANHEVDWYGGRLLGVPSALTEPETNTPLTVNQVQVFQADVNALRQRVNYQTYMQATAGIDTTRIEDWVQRDDDDLLGNNYQRLVVQQTQGWIASGVINRIIATGPIENLTPDDLASVRGFIALLVQYMVGAAWWRWVPLGPAAEKNLAPFFAKMDLAEYRMCLDPNAGWFIQQVAPTAQNELWHVHGTELQHVVSTEQGIRRPPGIADIAAFITGALTGQLSGFTFGDIFPLDELPDDHEGLPLEFRAIRARPMPEEVRNTGLDIVRTVRGFHGLD